MRYLLSLDLIEARTSVLTPFVESLKLGYLGTRMKIWLDDLRTPPEGWVWLKSSYEAMCYLANNLCEEISLDNDLGKEEPEGYEVLDWLEEAIEATDYIQVPIIHIHTSNPEAARRMRVVRERLYARERQRPERVERESSED